MVVKFQVERRPIGPSGKVYRGTEPGDYVSVLSNPTHSSLGGPSGIINSVKRLGNDPVSYVPAGQQIPKLNDDMYSHVVEVPGEPWLVHSSHFSLESALESAAPLAGAIGAENVRIVKVLSHSTQFLLK